MISGDRNILLQGSSAHARLELQQSTVEQLDAFVWPGPRSWLDILQIAKANNYDVVTAQDPFWRGLLAWQISLWTGARLNLQVHTDLGVQSFFRYTLARFLLSRADSVRVVSKKIAQQVQNIYRAVPVYVLPVYVDIRRFKNMVPESHEGKIILWIGRFEQEKDPLEAIRILKEATAAGLQVHLIMLGSGSLESSVRHAARALSVEFPGWQNPVPFLRRADVVLCTSLHESWGASIVEALAAGVPVVAPDVGIAAEAGAFVVDQNDLSSKVIEVLEGGMPGKLLLDLSTAEEWAKRWREIFI